MASYTAHDWLISVNTLDQGANTAERVVTTAVCARCGLIRSAQSGLTGDGQIDLKGECETVDEPLAAPAFG